jgi:hypothetical protein
MCELDSGSKGLHLVVGIYEHIKKYSGFKTNRKFADELSTTQDSPCVI